MVDTARQSSHEANQMLPATGGVGIGAGMQHLKNKRQGSSANRLKHWQLQVRWHELSRQYAGRSKHEIQWQGRRTKCFGGEVAWKRSRSCGLLSSSVQFLLAIASACFCIFQARLRWILVLSI